MTDPGAQPEAKVQAALPPAASKKSCQQQPAGHTVDSSQQVGEFKEVPLPSQSQSLEISGEDDVLRLVAHPDENVCMVQIGHLQSWFSSKMQRAVVHVPEVTTPPVAAGLLSSLFLFPNLKSLTITIAKPSFVLRQAVFCAISELAHLQHLHLLGGSLPGDALDLEVLRSLRRLEVFHFKPCKNDGLEDDHVAGLAHLPAATMKCLAFRGSENLSDDGLQHLSTLRGLTQLQILPLGLGVTREGVAKLLLSLPRLNSLSAGLQQVGQVSAVRDCGSLRQVSLVANDPEASNLEWSGLLSHCTLCLQTSLVTLRMGLLKMQDASFMLAIATLSQLTELKFAVRPTSISTPKFCCDVLAFTSLQRLVSLDVACTAQLSMPFTPRTASVACLSWPQLESLSLSVMGRRELVPEALALLDCFHSLRFLSLCCALDYTNDSSMDSGDADDPQALQHVPLSMQYLPRGLLHLQLEHAALTHPVATAQSPSPILPSLLSLQLDDCRVHDVVLAEVLGASTGLRHLELNCIDGLSEQGLCERLTPLSSLEHVVLCNLSAGPSKGQAAAAAATKSHWSLEHLVSAVAASGPSLLHLEWAPNWTRCPPLTRTQAGLAVHVLSSFSSLRFLYVQATGDMGHSWLAELRLKLPLCSVTSDVSATLVSYDIYNDHLIHASGALMR